MQDFIDLSSSESSADAISKFNDILDENNIQSSKIKLILGNILFASQNIYTLKSAASTGPFNIQAAFDKYCSSWDRVSFSLLIRF